MKPLKYSLLLALFVAAFSACEQVIEIDLPEHEAQIVVNSTFNTDSVVWAQVTISRHLQDTASFQYPEDVLLELLEEGLPFDTLRFTGPTYPSGYRGSKLPMAGKNYTLRASKTGYTTVEGTDMAPLPLLVDQLTYEDSLPTLFEDQVWDEITFRVQDPAATKDYYFIGIELSDSVEVFPGQWEVYSYTVGATSEDPTLERDFYGNSLSFTDDSFQGDERVFRLRVLHDDIAYGTAKVVLMHVSENYFRYLRSLSAYEETQFNPFAEPVIIHSNMSPQMGIFAGYSKTSVIVPK